MVTLKYYTQLQVLIEFFRFPGEYVEFRTDLKHEIVIVREEEKIKASTYAKVACRFLNSGLYTTVISKDNFDLTCIMKKHVVHIN